MSRLFLIALALLSWPGNGAAAQAGQKPVAILYFATSLADFPREGAALERVCAQAGKDFALNIKTYPLADDTTLADTVEKIADGDTGFIVIVKPQHLDALMKIPGLYPDIHFSIIDVDAPLYLTNVQSLLFKREEGAFLLGAMAAMHAAAHPIGFISAQDNKIMRNLAYGFFQGAKTIQPGIEVLRQFGLRTGDGKSVSVIQGIEQQLNQGADSLFLPESDLWPTALHLAQSRQGLIITTGDAPPDAAGSVLTSLRIRYDLALYESLKAYHAGKWKPETISLGIAGGMLDYRLDNSNKALFSPALIEKIEELKDRVVQGAIRVAPYSGQ